MPESEKNGRNLRGWILLAVVLAGIIFTAATILTTHSAAIADHQRRIGKVEDSQTKILQSLLRIELKLVSMEKKEKGSWNER